MKNVSGIVASIIQRSPIDELNWVGLHSVVSYLFMHERWEVFIDLLELIFDVELEDYK